MSVTIADVQLARRTIAGHVLCTPMLPAPKLSVLTGAEVFVKYENLQVTNSFKERGALNKLASLSEQERSHGIIAMSAGNHAQAVAYHAARLGIPATIVMPVTTPFVKIEATQAHHAEVVLDGDTVAEAQLRAETLARERRLTWVHPYDDLSMYQVIVIMNRRIRSRTYGGVRGLEPKGSILLDRGQNRSN